MLVLANKLSKVSVTVLLLFISSSFAQLLDNDLCFSSIVEAMFSNLERTEECTGSGGDASGLQITPQDSLWCLIGYCYMPSSSSGGNTADDKICRAAANELIDDMASLILDCTYGKPDNSHNYNIEYFKDNPSERSFCITGECKYGSDSSSSGEEESSSSSETVSSSSDIGSGYGGESCEISDYYWDYMHDDGFQRTLYSDLPSMQKKEEINFYGCTCSGNDLFYCRFGNLGYVDDYLPISLELCGYTDGYWCNGIEEGYCDFSGKSVSIYHADIAGLDWLMPNRLNDGQLYRFGDPSSLFGVHHYVNNVIESSEVFLHHRFVLPFNFSVSDLESTVLESLPDFPSLDKLHAYCRGEWVPHDEDCFGTEEDVLAVVNDSADACGWFGGSPRYTHALSGRGWCVVGECEFNDMSSSSGEEPSSSSSEEISSSSNEEISSSSESDDCTEPPGYVSLPDGINTCIKKDNKCYVCNPDRGADCSLPWLWTGEQVNQEYWFKEVNCSGSGSVSSSSSAMDIGGWGGSSSSGICPSHPLSSVPSNPLSACFEKNGRCYKCNSARGSECSNNWLWIYDFVPGNIGYWYEETSCDNKCPDGTGNSTFSLQRKSVFENSKDNERKDVSYEVWGNKTKFYYDALGRRTQADPNTRRYLFEAPRSKIMFNKGEYPKSYISNSFLLKTSIDGFVDAEHTYKTEHYSMKKPEKCDCSDEISKECDCSINFEISLSFATTIKNVEHENNPILKAHEDKHKEIYNSLGNLNWKKIMQINYCEESYETVCSRYKQEIKADFESRLKTLVNAQNEFDDNDTNNVSHARIDLQEKLNEMYQKVNSFDCPDMR